MNTHQKSHNTLVKITQKTPKISLTKSSQFQSNYLKSTDVEVITKSFAQPINRLTTRVPRSKRNTQIEQCLDSIRAKNREMPSNYGTPIMTHQKDLVNLHGIKKRDEVTHHMEWGVVSGARGWVRVAIAPQVGCYGTVPGCGRGEKLVAPWVPEFREAMEEEDCALFGFSNLGYVYVYVVCLYCFVLYLLHFFDEVVLGLGFESGVLWDEWLFLYGCLFLIEDFIVCLPTGK